MSNITVIPKNKVAKKTMPLRVNKKQRGIKGVPEKEVWEMTFEEFSKLWYHSKYKKEAIWRISNLPYEIRSRNNTRGNNFPVFFVNDDYSKYSLADAKKSIHKTIIQKAISENKNIPAEVLAEYPELLKEKSTNLLQQYKKDSEGLAGINEDLLKMKFVSSQDAFIEKIHKGIDTNFKVSHLFLSTIYIFKKKEDVDYFSLEIHEKINNEKFEKVSFSGSRFIFDIIQDVYDNENPIYVAKNIASELLDSYKKDSQGLQGIKKETTTAFTAYITAANPRQDKQGRGKLLVQAQKERVKALKISNIALLKKSEQSFEDLKNFNFEALLALIGKYPNLSIKNQNCELIGYWAAEPEPSMQLDFLAATKKDFWQTIKSLTDFAQTHSQDAFIVSVPLTNTERTAIEKDEILINTQTSDGFWYSPVFNLPFANLTTKEQLSIEAEFYKTFGEVGFSMYIYKSKIDNRTVNYKLIFSHEIAKNIDEFFKIIEKTVANIITARSKKFKSSEGFKSNVRKVIELIGKGRESLDYDKVMFFSADNFNGDSRSYSKVLAEIDSKMKGLAGLGDIVWEKRRENEKYCDDLNRCYDRQQELTNIVKGRKTDVQFTFDKDVSCQ